VKSIVDIMLAYNYNIFDILSYNNKNIKMRDEKIQNNFYEKYVGCYAKRFYTPFEENKIFPIVGFEIIYNDFVKSNLAYFKCRDEEWADIPDSENYEWLWDVEDCVVITNEQPEIEDERVANIFNAEYKGYNPYTKQII